VIIVIEVTRQFADHWAGFASIAGVLISIVGFALTLIGVAKSRNAALSAKNAVAEVRQKLAVEASVVDLARVIAEVEELKVFHRANLWDALPSRYTSIRRNLLAIKGTHPNLTRGQKADIQGVIGQFVSIEQIVEAALAAKQNPPDAPTLNKIAAEQGDKINAILVSVQQAIGR
jgi:hypothetical protein